MSENEVFHDAEEKTQIVRKLLYKLENALRSFVDSKIESNNQRIDKNILKRWENTRKREKTPPREPLDYSLIHYSTFDDLKLIIFSNNENWSQLFQKQFKRSEPLSSRLTELDSIRNTIAHNRLLSDFDYRSFIMLYEQLASFLPECEHLKKELIIEAPSFEFTQCNSPNMFGIIDITQLKINNHILTEIYRKCEQQAMETYDDPKLSSFVIQVFPNSLIGRNEGVFLTFYSKKMDKIVRFQFSIQGEYYQKLQRIHFDFDAKHDFHRKVFHSLPWKKSPKWKQYFAKIFTKIGPIPLCYSTSYYILAEAYRKNPWRLEVVEPIKDKNYVHDWDGK